MGGVEPDRAASDLTGPEPLDGVTRHLDPRVRLVRALGGLAPVAALGAAGVLAAVVTDRAELVPLVVLGALVGAVVAVGWAQLAFACFTWAAWPDALALRHGVLTRHESVVPYHRIQQIDVQRGPLDRALGLSTLVLRTAAATTDARILGVDARRAGDLRDRLLARAGTDDAV